MKSLWSRLSDRSGRDFALIAVGLLVLETILSSLIIKKVPYTEIDWVAYMEEVGEHDGFLSGERDYMNMQGGTGPLVYPAGFVYFFSALYKLTSAGKDIALAQWFFLGFYLCLIAVVLAVYKQTRRVPAWGLLLVVCSRRIHSIFVLRLFNDGIAMLVLYIAVLLFTKNRWSLGCFVFSLAVSVKMNVLLFAPPLLVLLLQRFGPVRTLPKLSICALTQIVLGWPFLSTFPLSYLGRAFNVGKAFEFKWSVNMQFLSETTFLGAPLAISLLATFVVVDLLAAHFLWSERPAGLSSLLRTPKRLAQNLNPAHIVWTLFTGNFFGIVFAKSLHYQFYVWYFHQLPFLVLQTRLPTPIKLVWLAAMELIWNMYPPRPDTSLALWVLHAILVAAIWASPKIPVRQVTKNQAKKAA